MHQFLFLKEIEINLTLTIAQIKNKSYLCTAFKGNKLMAG